MKGTEEWPADWIERSQWNRHCDSTLGRGSRRRARTIFWKIFENLSTMGKLLRLSKDVLFCLPMTTYFTVFFSDGKFWKETQSLKRKSMWAFNSKKQLWMGAIESTPFPVVSFLLSELIAACSSQPDPVGPVDTVGGDQECTKVTFGVFTWSFGKVTKNKQIELLFPKPVTVGANVLPRILERQVKLSGNRRGNPLFENPPLCPLYPKG